MKVVNAGFEILDSFEKSDGKRMLKNIERCGRVCYKSEKNITDVSADKFVRNVLKNKHESVIEHEKITVKITCDRGISHEIVRHRIASYSQESTRYCNYSTVRFGRELTFVKPCFFEMNSQEYSEWVEKMEFAEKGYLEWLDRGITPEKARIILPHSLKTEIVMTMNLREWRHFFKLRIANDAHPQVREISIPLLNKFKEILPAVFDDIIL